MYAPTAGTELSTAADSNGTLPTQALGARHAVKHVPKGIMPTAFFHQPSINATSALLALTNLILVPTIVRRVKLDRFSLRWERTTVYHARLEDIATPLIRAEVDTLHAQPVHTMQSKVRVMSRRVFHAQKVHLAQ